MTRSLFTTLTLAAWWFATETITDPYWPNAAARVESQQLQRLTNAVR